LASFCILQSAFCISLVGQEPAAFPQNVEARPISEAAATPTSSLRWQAKPQATVTDYVASDAAAQPINSNTPQPAKAGWNITRIDPSVRPAQYAGNDPFKDPFGDRAGDGAIRVPSGTSSIRSAPAPREPELILQPTQAETGVEELPAPRRFSPVRQAVPDEPAMTVARQPNPTFPRRTGPEPPPAAMNDMFQRSSQPCDRVYNDRNCCEHETNCIAFRDRLLSDSIRNISLDITPRYNPDLSLEDDEADRADKLRLLETRTWLDRRGRAIATGKMSALSNNAVVVVDDAGKESRLPINELGEDSLCYITSWWRLPAECPLGGLRNAERNWMCSTVYYHASALCHKPLYFEEVQLERYGHTAGPFRQPIISGAHFITNLALLPYHMGINPPTECQYALGYYRPGSCAPWMIQPFPLSLRGAAAEVGVALGMIYIIP
jgi:hypothetical protein